MSSAAASGWSRTAVLQLERQYRESLIALGLPASLHARVIEKLLHVRNILIHGAIPSYLLSDFLKVN